MPKSPLLLCALLASCAAPRPPVAAPASAPPAPPPAAIDNGAPPRDTLISYRVPGFRPAPSAWGPRPPGEPHREREREVDLQHQIVRVRFDWERRAVLGSTELRVAALPDRGAIESFALDASGMTIRRVTDERGRALVHEYDGRTLRVRLASPLGGAARARVVIDYEAERPRRGLYFVARRHVVWTQGAAEETRYWVPTYDYPNDKATWEVIVRAPRGQRALSNGRLVGSRRVGDETEWHWHLTKPASTYLMSVVVGDYVVLQDRWRNVPIGYWTYRDSLQAAWRGFAKTPRAMQFFSEWTAFPYPWEKYDQSAVPDFTFGGMENVTATTQSDDAVLHPAWAEPQSSSDRLVAHELSHQWFGDLVTTRDWSHAWLNEGFATFMEQLFREWDRGGVETSIGRLLAQETAIEADLRARRPLVYDRWVDDPLELFGSHIYQKGASVLQMLRRALGDSLFREGVRRYLRAHQFGSATTEDLRMALEAASGRSLTPFFAQWVYGAGVPAVRIGYAYDSARATLTLDIEQVQPIDSLTGYFEADVAVEVLTDSGTVRRTVEMRGQRTVAAIPLSARPRSIRWDKGGWLLDIVDFPRPTVMLAHQLARDDDPIGRIEAVTELAPRAAVFETDPRKGRVAREPRAVAALAGALGGDPVWAVRARAATALAGASWDSLPRAALVAGTRDRDARVREASASALSEATAGVAPVLARLAEADSSRHVRVAALVALTRVDPERGWLLARAALERDEWRDLVRAGALSALAWVRTSEARAALRANLGPSRRRETRLAAVSSLVAHSGSDADAAPDIIARDIAPLLDDPDPILRRGVAAAMGRLGGSESLARLEARRRIEPEPRVRQAIDAALAAIRRDAAR